MFCIEGNIGVGKTTLIKSITKDFPCFEEPVEEWTLLENFYENPKEFAFSFQFQILITQFNIFRKIFRNKDPLVFVERSHWSSKNVFIDLMKDGGIWSSEDEVSYDKLYRNINVNFKKIFYLNLAPEKCLERIKKRSRKGEENVTLEFLQKIHNKYNDALLNCPFEVVYIDCLGKTTEEIKKEIYSYI